MKYLMLGAAALALAACSQQTSDTAATHEPAATPVEEMAAGDAEMTASEKLSAVLDAQSDETKARYQYRHPQETLEFFGVEPGMTVADTLPGNPWYSGILIDYLGPDGKVLGADYSEDMWTKFGQFSPPAGEKATWAADWTADAESWRDDDGDAAVGAFAYGSAPDDMAGTVDVILMIRAAHHFNRLDDGVYFTEALADSMKLLKPGGIVGVVQHRAQEDMPDEWATGDNGYVKESQIVSAFEAAGFELVASSEVNANPADRPTAEEFVWRLPPTLATSRENEELKAQMMAIGESDRMTLKFRKPE
ncbi:class I SAM-dependent methyltransferase [Hyphococcus sp.]|uniref:class I SAM-dependent methyltransferase n=1 Tax=Hyphococcus sp. TaxID=2038636 RepID=UPI0020847683|nr:MAG: methyltransferase [Marinicaulis sp.]